MNELEKEKDRIVTKRVLRTNVSSKLPPDLQHLISQISDSDARFGFDAAIALGLPVKFHKWAKEWPFGFKRNDEFHKVMETIYPDHKTAGYGVPTEEELYKYWIENIFKTD